MIMDMWKQYEWKLSIVIDIVICLWQNKHNKMVPSYAKLKDQMLFEVKFPRSWLIYNRRVVIHCTKHRKYNQLQSL